MSDDSNKQDHLDEQATDEAQSIPIETDETIRRHTLGGMYKNWFLDYASYVILQRAVPHIEDGFKPVQRRIIYTMRKMENGTLHKVAKIAGATMALHPHGDASINDSLVQLGQKGFLIDIQGNWGNIFTGDSAAAARYIEAKLSNFALDILSGDKVTPFKKSYDGKMDEPIYMPVKFPLLLSQGAEGIAVGLTSKILPHNPAELLEAACQYLQGEPFTLYPDFPTGGQIDVEKYQDGARGGSIRNRATIEKVGDRILSIKDLPYGKNTTKVIESILKANEKGKIKIKRVDDMTAQEVDVRIQLPSGVSTDKTIDGLYAFTECEQNIWPNACVIENERPIFVTISDLLKHSADKTLELLKLDLEIQLKERQEQYMNASLERIFIINRIYKDEEFENAASEREALDHTAKRLDEVIDFELLRPISNDDLKHLLEIKMAKILRFNLDKHNKDIVRLEKEITKLKKDIRQIVPYTIKYYKNLLEQYGHEWERKTQITKFGTIEATKIVEANRKLYIDRKGGFIGTALKEAEFVCDCSDLDDIIIFFTSGKYIIHKVEDKLFIGKEKVIHIDRYRKGDKRTVYNVIYRDGKGPVSYIKRFNITSTIRDTMYDLTQGAPNSRVLYFTANKNGEAEIVTVKLVRVAKKRVFTFEKDFSETPIRNKNSKGNIVTKAAIEKILLKEQGGSTLGGRKVWFDADINRINYNQQGEFIDEFEAKDSVFVLLPNGEAYTTDFSESNHFAASPLIIEKLEPQKVWTVIYFNKEKQHPYLKRFTIGDELKPSLVQGDGNKLLFYTDKLNPIIRLRFGGKDSERDEEVVNCDDFIGTKSISAKGKRLCTYQLDEIILEHFDEPIVEEEIEESATATTYVKSSINNQSVAFESNQLFYDNEEEDE